VRADCIIQKVVRDQRFSVSDAELFAYAKAMAQSQKRSIDEVVGFLRRNKNVVDRMSNEIQERKALDWRSGQCTIEDKEVSFEGLKDLFGAAEDSL
jgi:FKBP-type peptidyl-prolyl cis-trans isomerase (trigger factor)